MRGWSFAARKINVDLVVHRIQPKLAAIGISKLIGLLIPSLPSSIPLWAVISGLTVSVAIGLIFGVWPARKASRLDPIECLRYE